MSELSEQLVAALPENFGSGPEWLKVLRQSGADEFRTHGLPTRKDEAWKYTGLGALAQGEVMLATGFEALASGSTHPTPLVEKELQINMLDGQFLAEIGNQCAGLTVLPMAEALKHGPTGLQALLESLADT